MDFLTQVGAYVCAQKFVCQRLAAELWKSCGIEVCHEVKLRDLREGQREQLCLEGATRQQIGAATPQLAGTAAGEQKTLDAKVLALRPSKAASRKP